MVRYAPDYALRIAKELLELVEAAGFGEWSTVAVKVFAHTPAGLLLEFDGSVFVVDPHRRKLPQNVLTKESVNLSAHPLTGVREVHHQDAPIHPMAPVKSEVHFPRDVIAFGTGTHLCCL